MLTQTDDIVSRLRSFDKEHLDGLYLRARYLMGDNGQRRTGDIIVGEDGFPIYPDIVLQGRKIGQSRRLLNSAITALSRVMASEPDPTWPQVDRTTGEMRRQWFLQRYRLGGWGREMESAFMDGDQLGVGVVQVGAKRSGASGEQYVSAVHVPVTQVLYDPLEPSIGRSNWIAFVHYIQPERAFAMFGKARCEPHVRKLWTMADGKAWPYVRVTEYFDLGYGHGYDRSEPTMATFVGSWQNNEPVFRQRSPFPSLPCAYFEYVTPPMVRRPIGKVELGLATAEALNELENRLRGIVKKGVGFDVVDATQLNAQDLERVRRGEEGVIVRLENPPADNRPPFIRVPDREVASALLQLLQLQERQWNADSQTTELDRGSQLQTVRTATEAALLDNRSQTQSVHTRREALRMAKRLVEVAAMVGALADRDPVEVDVFGVNLTLNDPEDPRLRLDSVFKEPSSILLSPQSLEAQDTLREQQMKLARLQALQPLVGAPGGIPTQWYAKQLLEAIGEEDVDEILTESAPQPPAGPPPMDGPVDPSMMDPALMEQLMASSQVPPM